MRAWIFQDTKQLAKRGPKQCPWSVGWYDGRGRQRRKTIGTKTGAKAYARKLEGEAAAGLLTSHDRMRWASFVERFDRDHLSTLAAASRVLYGHSLAHFTRLSAPNYVDQIDSGLVDEFRAKRLAEGVEPATVNRDLRHVRCALNKARKWKLIAEQVEVELLREPERDAEFVDDETFAALYAACDTMTLPVGPHYGPSDWWKALLTFAYMTGWRIREILALRRDEIDFANGVATLAAENTKGKRDVRVELHPLVIDHLRAVVSFDELVFVWPQSERLLWTHFANLKKAAGVDFSGAFHPLRFGFANENVDRFPEVVLQQLMRHKDRQTTRRYINRAKRLQRQQGTADRQHVPACFAERA